MSDDDGMLLNFTMSDEPNVAISKRATVTSGTWKERRMMKMKLEGKEPKKRSNGKDDGSNRRNKRRDVAVDDLEMTNDAKATWESFSGESGASDNQKGKQKKDGPSNVIPAHISSQVVTSLFTSNRKIDTLKNINQKNEDEETNPSNAPLIADDFESSGVSDILVKHLHEKLKIDKPTSIQKLVLPQLLSNNNEDLFIHAQTGSGKTLAFLLPILSRILNMKTRVDRKSGCFAIIIIPTRELAQQIYQVLISLTGCCHYLVPCLLIGGESKKSEKARLRKGCNFIIGTPGRVLDHFQNTESVKTQLGKSLRYLLFDEGDKLMELGFEETLSQILSLIHSIPIDTSAFPSLPSRIVNILSSATTKGDVTKLGNVALKNYKMISNGKMDNNALTSVPDQLVQSITIVPPKLRLVTLGAYLDSLCKKHKQQKTKDASHVSRTIIFLSCADNVDFHYEVFSSSDSHHGNLVGDSVRILTKGNTIFPSVDPEINPDVICYKLHGSLTQQMRTSTLQHFSKESETVAGKHLIMFCTDVASRGLDLPQVGTVIELDPPFAVEDHLHRIGRTARAGKSGESLLFLLPGEEEGYMEYIKPYHPKGWKMLNYTDDILKPTFQNAAVSRNDKSKARNSDEWDINATTWHLNLERRLLEDNYMKELAVKAYISHTRAYATHISKEKKFFNIKFVHLGHLAKSFGLRERPRTMGFQTAKHEEAESKKAKRENPKNKMFRLAREAQKQSFSEFNY
ncbi:hypothetical protein TPHA_0B01270 [Tetrapisispora phaffii CBS 4417]|uniref:ATP-dependent RNA helicase n=1 Tax=Tetrapisispora phaffii (strain ATCC 24235 / CBS 4417 / NBRC 1672 / NRRL Y-8282 / UCD 70-5) TaxID=1071381 RepID=G8BP69_TETPH|nr:hypothetical protein TPHA_0B01270 [Tetrapisispora phaffii CBS 4417]CCE61800.1 hypothetical protein TPHA_0B01270 [Tetrapisispora phaffii CBS 4417]